MCGDTKQNLKSCWPSNHLLSIESTRPYLHKSVCDLLPLFLLSKDLFPLSPFLSGTHSPPLKTVSVAMVSGGVGPTTGSSAYHGGAPAPQTAVWSRNTHSWSAVITWPAGARCGATTASASPRWGASDLPCPPRPAVRCRQRVKVTNCSGPFHVIQNKDVLLGDENKIKQSEHREKILDLLKLT